MMLDWILTSDQARQTAEAIADVQLPSGAIGWCPGGHVDPWDHVQSVMGLTVAGRYAEALRGFQWLADTQRRDGSWGMRYERGRCVTDTIDANFCAYPATGLWHYWLVTGDEAATARYWPVVRRGLAATLRLQGPHGAVQWAAPGPSLRAASPTVEPGHPTYLVTGNASIAHSLECAAKLAEIVGDDGARYRQASSACKMALRAHPEMFTPKPHHAMDWYYPILCGVVRGQPAHERLDQRWADFVVPGRGVQCVNDHPWVTGAETCELVMALDAMGRSDQANELFASIQHLRANDGHYWTGLVYTAGLHWPVEQSTWTSATVLLAADALGRCTGGSGLFREGNARCGS